MSMNRKSVYELAQESAGLLQAGADGFDTDEQLAAWEAELANWVSEADDKLVACRAVIERAEAEQEWLEVQSKKLKERAKRHERTQQVVKDLALQLLAAHEEATGQRKVQTSDGSSVSVAVRENVAVDVADINGLLESAPEFVRQKLEPDLVALKKAIADGREFPGVTWQVTQSRSLRWGK